MKKKLKKVAKVAKRPAKKKPAAKKEKKSMSETIGIDGRLRQINVACDEHGRIEMDDDEARHERAPRAEGVKDGTNNVGLGNILIFDFDGHPDKISKEDNDRTDNVVVEVKTVRGRGKESVTTYSVGKKGDGQTEKDGDAPFDADVKPEGTERTHMNLFHLRCTTNDGHMQCSVRQVRTTDDGVFVSEWIGPLKVGRQ